MPLGSKEYTAADTFKRLQPCCLLVSIRISADDRCTSGHQNVGTIHICVFQQADYLMEQILTICGGVQICT